MKKVITIEPAAAHQPKKRLRVAAYCRVSTASDEQLVSLETQKAHYEEYIASNPEWEFAGLYYDEGLSGTKKEKRPALLQMITDCENGKIDFIVTKSLSRFARNTTDCLELVRRLLKLHISIYFEKENLNTGSMETELFLSVMSSLAESESVSISENNKWGARHRFENGTFRLSYAPYGYSLTDGKLVIKDGDNKTVFSGDINEGAKAVGVAIGVFAVVFAVIMFFVCVIGTLLDIFVINPVRVGGYNFFNRQREGTSKFTNIFGGFAHGHYKASIRNMFLKDLYEFLWSMLFIIPGIIKSYSYWMVPYITAANPNLSASRVFEISKKTMSGEKWRTFVLQLSFIGWELLAILTFGIGAYFLAPYQETTYAELYAVLRQKAIANGIATEEELAIAA